MFAKEFGQNKKLGQVFWDAIVSIQFASQATKFPHVRIACVAANLISPKSKVVDGIARLVTKGDILQLQRKQNLLHITAAEELLTEAWATLDAAVIEQRMSESERCAVFGKLSSRVVLYLTKKEKEGLEGKSYGSFAAIKATYLLDSGKREADTFSNDRAEAQESHVGYGDVSNPRWIAQSNGFASGKYYYEKDTHQVFLLDVMGEENVKFIQHTLAASEREVKVVSYDDLRKKWSLFNGKIQSKVVASIAPHQVKSHALLAADLDRARLFQQLHELAVHHAEGDRLDYFYNPSQIRAKCDIAKGELVLVPIAPLNSILLKSSTARVIVTSNGAPNLFIEMPTKAKSWDAKSWQTNTVFAAYWWVKGTTEKPEANMQAVELTTADYRIPAFKNARALKAFEKLQFHAAPAVPTAAKAAPATKKART